MTDDRFEELLVKVVDGVASPAEKEELMSAIVDHPDRRKELEAHLALKAVTDGWVDRLRLDRAEDAHARQGLTRLEGGMGAALFVVGLGLLLGGGLFTVWQDPEVPLWVRLGLSSLAGGSLILLLGALRWRWSTGGDDAYTEVIR